MSLNYFSSFNDILRVVSDTRSLGHISIKILSTVGVQTFQQLLRGYMSEAREIYPGSSIWVIFLRLLYFADITEISASDIIFILFMVA